MAPELDQRKRAAQETSGGDFAKREGMTSLEEIPLKVFPLIKVDGMAGICCLCRLPCLPKLLNVICGRRLTKNINCHPQLRLIHAETWHFTQQPANDNTGDGDKNPPPDLSMATERENGPKYPGHIHTTCFQKSLLAVGSATLSLATPWRDDMIAVMGEVTGDQAIRYMHGKMKNDHVGSRILEERPRINSKTVDYDHLRTLPEDTFGKKYIDFIGTEKIDPDGRRPVQFVDEPDLAYVMQRYREVHDLIHVLLGMPTHMLGEVVVKWIEGLQLGLPLGLLGGMFGALRLRPKQRSLYLQEHLWWALRVGRNADFLLNIYFEEHWEQNIHEMREQFKIEEPPSNTPKKIWRKS